MIIDRSKKVSLKYNNKTESIRNKFRNTNEIKTIFCLIGPSASGKTTLIQDNKDSLNFGEIISTTTRTPRKNEVDGKDYNFVSKEDFNKLEMLEKDEYASDYYGTSLNAIIDSLKDKNGTMTAITYEGYQNIKKYFIENRIENIKVISVFIDASKDILKERMISRGDSPKNIEKRLKNIETRHEFDNMFKTDFIFLPTDSRYKTNENFCNLINYCEYGQQFFENIDFAIENTKAMKRFVNKTKDDLLKIPYSEYILKRLYHNNVVSLKDLSATMNIPFEEMNEIISSLEKTGVCYKFSRETNVFTHDSVISACLTGKGEILARTGYLYSIKPSKQIVLSLNTFSKEDLGKVHEIQEKERTK